MVKSKRRIPPRVSLPLFGMQHRQRISCTPLENMNIRSALHRHEDPVERTILALDSTAVESCYRRLARVSSIQGSLFEEPRCFTACRDDAPRKEARILSSVADELTVGLTQCIWKTFSLFRRRWTANVLLGQPSHGSPDRNAHLVDPQSSHDICSKKGKNKNVMMAIPNPRQTPDRIIMSINHNRRSTPVSAVI